MAGLSDSLRKPRSMTRVLAYTSVCSCVFNLIIILVCLSAGRWVFGDAMCQIFAFLSHVMVGSAAWLVALTGLERYYKLFLPSDHQCVFSDINTRILVLGIYLLVAVILTSPLYGWGEFTEYRGYFHFGISWTDNSTREPISVETFGLSNMTNSTKNDVETCVKTAGSPEDLELHQLNLTHFTQVIQTSLKSKWDLKARLWGVFPNLTYLMRAKSSASLENFETSYLRKDISRHLLSSAYNNCDCFTEGKFLCTGFSLNHTEVEIYRNLYLPFQGPMMCSVDFTTMNKVGSGFLAFFVLTTAIMPYGFIFILTAAITIQWRQIGLDVSKSDCVKTSRLLLGACVSVLFYVPYFVVNIVNSSGYYVSGVVHASALVMYYSCSLVPCVMCIDKNCLRKEDPQNQTSASQSTREDIEFELLQTPDV